ncbi:MAG: thiopurine S-methyltransferase [Gammaproteobacteria bacterium]
MDSDFWQQRWSRNEIGFHQSQINPLLVKYWPRLPVPADCRVLVPLCGKSLDMLWLRDRGHEVVGVELSPVAAAAFAQENNLAMRVRNSGAFECHEGDGLVLLVGDFFALTQDDIGDVPAVYDRAAMVALPAPMRRRYAEHLRNLLPVGTQTLLISFDYDQGQMDGPPFSVSDVEVRELFGGSHGIELLQQADVLDQEPRFRQRGLTRLTESAYRLVRQ